MINKEEIYIVGASGFGREVAWLIEELDEWIVTGFVDDNDELINTKINEIPVLGTTDYLLKKNERINVVIAIGNPSIRANIYNKLNKKININYPNIIAKDVRLSKTNNLGIGNIICSHSILTVDINLGNFNHINLDCTIGHDVVISDFVTVYPSVNISGNVVIGNYCELGTGTQIIQGKKITDNAIIGAGTVVVKDLLECGTYIGVPAKKKNNNNIG